MFVLYFNFDEMHARKHMQISVPKLRDKTDLLAQFNLYLRYKAVEASSLSLMSSGASSDQKNFQRLLTIYAFYA